MDWTQPLPKRNTNECSHCSQTSYLIEKVYKLGMPENISHVFSCQSPQQTTWSSTILKNKFKDTIYI